MAHRSLSRRIGPAFVVGAVIIGPGSITIMSTTGATYGYQLLWLALLAGALMAGFIALFMRFGIYCDDTFLGVTEKKFGRGYAALCGLALFTGAASFQFGNNVGVTLGMGALVKDVSTMVWPVVFTAAAIVFMFTAKNIYRIVEKMMMVFLVGIFVAFLVNLVWARPDLPAAVKGALVPSLPAEPNWVLVGGLVATTFVIAAALFQSYLVKAKQWRPENLKDAAIDTILASVIYTLIGAVIMMTAATILYPHDGDVKFDTMVGQLKGVFGEGAVLVFAVGFWAAAFSSFITNSLIAGVMLSDGLGYGSDLNSRPVRIGATLALLVGMIVALVINGFASSPSAPQIDVGTAAIAIGQASSLVAVPLGAIAMVAVLLDKRATGGRDLPIWAKAFVLFGALVLLGVAFNTLGKLWPQLKALFGAG